LSSFSEWPRWNLRRKGFLVVCLPIAFQIALIVGLLYIGSMYDRDQVIERESKDAIAYIYHLVGIGTEVQSRIRGYAASGNPALAGPVDRLIAEFPIDLQNLNSIVIRTPAPDDDRLFADFNAASNDLLTYYGGALKDLRAGKRQAVLANMYAGIGQRLMERFDASSDRFLATERILDARRSAATANARTRIDVALIGGGALSIAVAAIVTVLFTQDIGRRVRVVADNMDRLERNEPLMETLSGGDEIAALDRRFHDMATALKESDEQWKRAEENLRRFSRSRSRCSASPATTATSRCSIRRGRKSSVIRFRISIPSRSSNSSIRRTASGRRPNRKASPADTRASASRIDTCTPTARIAGCCGTRGLFRKGN
jgi:CHASE3 domain sensor protein